MRSMMRPPICPLAVDPMAMEMYCRLLMSSDFSYSSINSVAYVTSISVYTAKESVPVNAMSQMMDRRTRICSGRMSSRKIRARSASVFGTAPPSANALRRRRTGVYVSQMRREPRTIMTALGLRQSFIIRMPAKDSKWLESMVDRTTDEFKSRHIQSQTRITQISGLLTNLT
jgi:hypothetical protein